MMKKFHKRGSLWLDRLTLAKERGNPFAWLFKWLLELVFIGGAR